MKMKSATTVRTAPLVALGLMGGFVAARETGVRPLGGLVLGACGLYAARTWAIKGGAPAAIALSALYLGGFGLSHPLAKKLGAWPSVLAVTALNAAASHWLVDRSDD